MYVVRSLLILSARRRRGCRNGRTPPGMLMMNLRIQTLSYSILQLQASNWDVNRARSVISRRAPRLSVMKSYHALVWA